MAATLRAQPASAGWAVTSSTRSPMSHRRRPSRRLSRYSAPRRTGMTAPPRRASARALAAIDLGSGRDGVIPARRSPDFLRFLRDDRHVSADQCRLPLQILLVAGTRDPHELAAAGELMVDRDPHLGRVRFVLGG